MMAKLTGQFLYLGTFYIIAKGKTHSMHTSTGSTTNTMEVTLGLTRKTEVYNCFYIWDVKTPGN